MAEERPDDPGPSPDSRPKRAPPTIDLRGDRGLQRGRQQAEGPGGSQGSCPTRLPRRTADGSCSRRCERRLEPEPQPETASVAPDAEPARPVSPWVVAPVSGARRGGAGDRGRLAARLARGAAVVRAAAQRRNDRRTRHAPHALEAKAGRPAAAAADPAATARLEALDKSIAALRTELAATRAQSDKLAAAVNDAKAAPRDGAAAPDISGITARIDKVEGAVKAQGAAIAKQDGKIADTKAEAKADDVPLRRVVAASLLDVAVRHGDPLASRSRSREGARRRSRRAEAARCVRGVRRAQIANALCRELIEIVPKLVPPAAGGGDDRRRAGRSSAGGRLHADPDRAHRRHRHRSRQHRRAR